MRSFILLLLATCHRVNSFYLPGVIPKNYLPGSSVPIKVNSLTSIETHVPYDYYKLPFCEPESIVNSAENLGELLTGNRIETSPYEIKMDQEEKCKVLCTKQYTVAQLEQFAAKVKEQYVVNWVVDNLPAAAAMSNQGTEVVFYEHGFFLGGFFVEEKEDQDNSDPLHKPEISAYFLNNHVQIVLKVHEPKPGQGKHIVGVEVVPATIFHKNVKPEETHITSPDACTFDANLLGETPLIIKGKGMRLSEASDGGEATLPVTWTYDVVFKNSDIKWASRWDIYLTMGHRNDNQVHWFSIVNSLLIVFLLTGMVAVIMLRTLRRDVLYYNRVPTEEERAEEKEESGWKLIHGHVFREPSVSPMLFSVLVGTGSQLFGMACFLIIFAAVGFLSPANRGSLMIAFLALFVLMATFAGYTSATTFKMFGGEQWQRCTLATALLFPGINFVIFFVVNAILWHQDSDGAVPFGSMFAVIALWLGVSLPLTFIGAYSGYKRDKVEPATPIVGEPAEIPPVQWYLSPCITVFVGGVLPFGVIFVELFFILSSLWLDQYYYVFGFLFVVFAIMVLVCSELTIVLCYFQLCAEDYRWWWRSFLTSGCCALYVFLYCIFYFISKLDVAQFVPAMVYFCYMFLMCLAFFLIAGTAGHTACYYFVRAIYGALKVD